MDTECASYLWSNHVNTAEVIFQFAENWYCMFDIGSLWQTLEPKNILWVCNNKKQKQKKNTKTVF